jgi:PAS domain S-box-containing protein
MGDELEVATLRASEDRHAFLLRLSDSLRPLSDPLDMEDAAARLLGEHLQANRVGYAEIADNRSTIRREWIRGVAPLAGQWVEGAFGEELTSAFRRGETVVVCDVGTDPRFSKPQRAMMRAMEMAAFAGVMLLKGGRLVAAFGANCVTPRNWTSSEVDLIRDVAERTWEAVERARAEAAVRGSEERLAFLLKLSDALRPLSDPVAMTGAAARLLGEHLKANRVCYADIDGDEFVMRHMYESGVTRLSDRGPVTCMGAAMLDAYRRGDAVAVHDAYTDPRLTEKERAGLQKNSIAAFAMVVMLKNGQWVSSLGVHSATARIWTQSEMDLIRDVAERIWEAIERARAETTVRANQERLQFMVTLNDALRPLNDPVEMQDVTVRLLGEHLRVNRVCYATIDGDDFVIERCYCRGVTPCPSRRPARLFGAALLESYRRGESVAVSDVNTDPRFTDAERADLTAAEIAAFAGVMLLKEGRWVAAFGVHSATPRVWTGDEIALIQETGERTWTAAERARAARELREREWRLRLALDASAGGSWTWEARTNRVDWDHGFRVRYGFAADVPPSQDTWLSRVHEDDRSAVLGSLDEMRQTSRESWDNTFRIVMPDGKVSWIQSLGRAERDDDGRLLRLTGLDLDVTERRLAEQAREARRDEKRDREMRLLLETTTQGILSVDAQGLIVTANRALESMFGWEGERLIGQPVERLVPAAFREPHTQHRAAYFASPRPRQMGVDAALFGQRKDGTMFPIEISLSHVATPGGGRAIAFVTDVTARKRAETALQERTAELERRTAQLRKMASDLTLAEQHAREQLAKTLHDGLQQLLVSAAMNLGRQVTREAQRGAENELVLQAKDNLDEAISAARSLSVELFPPVLHGSGLPAALVWLADWMRNQHGLQVQVSADPLANSDRKDVRTLLFESVRELLFNTVKHARVDRATLDLSSGADNTIRISVADQGIGFDPAKVHDGARDGQVGWGLFSIRERLTLLGGRLDVDSAPGRGTRFHLIVPNGRARVAGTPGSRHVAAGRTPLDIASPAPARALRILIVDDHAAVRKAFRELLQERPELHVVGEAANGLEAIAVAQAVRPDVILMDISMPEMDGVEATRRIRAELPFIQILGLSTHVRGGDRHAIEDAGAEGFFTKGIDTQRLIEHLIVVHASTASRLTSQQN